MSEVEGSVYVAPWPSKAKVRRRPRLDQLQFGCVCEINLGIDTVDETVHFVRGRHYDELWVQSTYDDEPWCAVRRLVQDDAATSCRTLFELLTRARIPFGGPSAVRRPGLVRTVDLEDLLRRIEGELEKVQRRANLWRSAGILRVAAELGLNPEPSVQDSKLWQANCPGTSHPLFINAELGEWGCGCCKRKGGVLELEKFVERRRAER